MNQDKYSRKIKLSATEISAISMNLRDSLNSKQKDNLSDAKEYFEMINKLKKRFQRLAVSIEKQVLDNIKSLR